MTSTLTPFNVALGNPEQFHHIGVFLFISNYDACLSEHDRYHAPVHRDLLEEVPGDGQDREELLVALVREVDVHRGHGGDHAQRQPHDAQQHGGGAHAAAARRRRRPRREVRRRGRGRAPAAALAHPGDADLAWADGGRPAAEHNVPKKWSLVRCSEAAWQIEAGARGGSA